MIATGYKTEFRLMCLNDIPFLNLNSVSAGEEGTETLHKFIGDLLRCSKRGRSG